MSINWVVPENGTTSGTLQGICTARIRTMQTLTSAATVGSSRDRASDGVAKRGAEESGGARARNGRAVLASARRG